MNKTVNINLAGVFFHIDEDAYAKLQHYLEAIKRSLTNTQGRDEIIADIEARIAELFNEKIKDKRQVIGNLEVEEVITIMGQPEDYMVDEEMFEDEPSYSSSTSAGTGSGTGKQLFRDTEHSYIGGVSSGLSHYLGIEAIWVRLLWVILTIASSGAFLLIYIALWIFVPEAKTTADKLSMRGEEVNISNIERKIKEGFDDVAGKVRNADFDKYGRRVKSGATSAATGISTAIMTLLKVFVKFIGLIILLISGSTLIALFIALFTVGSFGLVETPWMDYVEMAAIGAPLWMISILTFFAVGIPFFFLFVLGLKILVRKLKPIGTIAKMVLLAIWLLSVVGLTVLGIRQATSRAFDGEMLTTEMLRTKANDTLFVTMKSNPLYATHNYRNNVEIQYDETDNKVIYLKEVNVKFRSTTDSVGRVEIIKFAEGSDYRDARNRAKRINYGLNLEGNKLFINNYLTAALKDNYRDQKVRVIVYLPVGAVVNADQSVKNYTYNNSEENFLRYGMEDHFVTVTQDGAICETCPVEEIKSSEDENWDSDSWDEEDDFDSDDEVHSVRVNIDSNGISVKKNNSNQVKVNANGIEVKTDDTW